MKNFLTSSHFQIFLEKRLNNTGGNIICFLIEHKLLQNRLEPTHTHKIQLKILTHVFGDIPKQLW